MRQLLPRTYLEIVVVFLIAVGTVVAVIAVFLVLFLVVAVIVLVFLVLFFIVLIIIVFRHFAFLLINFCYRSSMSYFFKKYSCSFIGL